MVTRKTKINPVQHQELPATQVYPDVAAPSKTAGDLIFQRILLEYSILRSDQLTHYASKFIELQLQNNRLTFSDLLIQENVLTKQQVDRLLHLENLEGTPCIVGYKIEKLVGQGGMAAVYKAHAIGDENRKYAIKVFIPKEEVAIEILRFHREFAIAKTLDHPNILKAYDSGDFRGFYYIVMDFLEGKDLQTLVKENGPYPENRALEIFGSILAGMMYAWEAKIVHRDLKPANIILVDGCPRICDFGLAKATEVDIKITKTGVLMGTPQYMSPESFSQTVLDYRSDVYALGITLYYMLTGELPFAGKTLTDIYIEHMNKPVEFLTSQFSFPISRPLKAFVRKMLAKFPDERCKTPQELWEDLELVRKGKMPKGGIPQSYRKKRWKFAVALLLLSCLAVVGWFRKDWERVFRNKEQMQDSEKQKLQASHEARELERQKEDARLQLLAEQERIRKEKEDTWISEQERIRKEKEDARISEQERIRKEEEESLDKVLREKKLATSLRNIESDIHAFNFDLAHQKVLLLDAEFPKEKEVNDYKETIPILQKLAKYIEQGAITETCDAAPTLEKRLANLQFLYLLFQKYIKKGSDEEKLRSLMAWNEMNSQGQKELCLFFENEQGLIWFEQLVWLFPEPTQKIISKMAKSGLSKNQVFAQNMKLQLALSKFFKQGNAVELNRTMRSSMSDQFLEKVWQRFDTKNKTEIFQTLLGRSAKFEKQNLLKLLDMWTAENDPELRMELLTSMIKSNHSLCDKKIVEMMTGRDEIAIRRTALKGLMIRKQYSQMGLALKDHDVAIRRELLVLMPEIPASFSEKLLLQAMKDDDFRIRSDAAIQLGKMSSKDAVSILENALLDDHTNVSQSASWALGKIGDAAAKNALVRRLKKVRNVQEARQVAMSLMEIGGEASQQEILNCLMDSSYAYNSVLQDVFEAAGDGVIPLIGKQLRLAESMEDRKIMVKVMEKIPTPKSALILSDILDNTYHLEFQILLIEALEKIASPESVPVLLKHLKNKRVTRKVKKALEAIFSQMSSSDPHYQAVKEAVQ